MTSEELEFIKKMTSIFLPHVEKAKDEFIRKNCRFVHYTSAENAFKIIRGREVWMRNVRVMNDHSEVFHGIDQLANFFGKNKVDYETVLSDISPSIFSDVVKIFDENSHNIWGNSFISCVSEHDVEEDDFGRLSMWRAYGRGAVGVALVLNKDAFFCESDALNVAFCPVVYEKTNGINNLLFEIRDNIQKNIDFLTHIGRECVQKFLYHSLCILSLTIKHPGFKEEREWRVVYIHDSESSYSTEIVSGVPQEVKKINLENIPEKGLVGLDLNNLIDRVIVGPTMYPSVIKNSFIKELKVAGVVNAEEKVIISDIPLRV